MRSRSTVGDGPNVVAELNHRINSPLAAIRSALYLTGCHTTDPEIGRYLRIADNEVSAIAAILRDAREGAQETRNTLARTAAAGSSRAIA